MANEVLAIAGFLNLVFCISQFALYLWERNKGYVASPIANTLPIRKFLAPQDYCAGKWGGTIGLTVMNIGVGGIFFEELQFAFWMAIPPVLAVALSFGYYHHCRLTNKNDWTFTGGKLTRAGAVHLVYIVYQVSVGAIGVGFLTNGRFDTFMLVGLAGGLFYLLTFFLDVRIGNHGFNGVRPRGEPAT